MREPSPDDPHRRANRNQPARPQPARPLPARARTMPSPARAAQPRVARPLPLAAEEPEEEYLESESQFDIMAIVSGLPSWLVSMSVHMLLLVVLALLFVPAPPRSDPPTLDLAEAEEPEPLEEQPIELEEVKAPTTLTEDQQDIADPPPDATPPPAEEVKLEEGVSEPQELDSAWTDMLPGTNEFNEDYLPGDGDNPYALRRIGGDGDGPGGPQGAKEAVDAGLVWLAAHQMNDGGWSFDHTHGECQGRCGQPGAFTDDRSAATALALLAFLGRGNTHTEGDYKVRVAAGLRFLLGRMQPGPVADTISFHEPGGTMYSHGLATIALCEAYGMTGERTIGYPAQQALNFIMYAQDPVGGGWRYQVREAGDTSVVGWQLMALKSGQLAGLEVNPDAYQGAIHFFDSMQTDSGAAYGYTGPGNGTATTAIGLLSRMYLGWKRDHGSLERGGEFLIATGPSQSNLYYDYYATQVLLHLDNPQNDADQRFDDWDNILRPWLLETQEKQGHLQGSWYVAGDIGSGPGGRLYCTAMATLILEVYYRTSPIYKQEVIDLEFPL